MRLVLNQVFQFAVKQKEWNYVSIHNVWAPYGKGLAQD